MICIILLFICGRKSFLCLNRVTKIIKRLFNFVILRSIEFSDLLISCEVAVGEGGNPPTYYELYIVGSSSW